MIICYILITKQQILYSKYKVNSHIDELVEVERINSASGV